MKPVGAAISGTIFFAFAVCLPLSAQTGEGFIHITPEQVPFKSPFGTGPAQAVLFGDPSKPGVYLIRVRFPPGAHSNPHFHSQDRHVTVIKGVWWMGTGEELDFNKAVPMKTGSYILHPAGAAHWDGAGDEETIVQIVGIGPVETVQVGPEGAPSGYWPKPK